MKKFLFFWLLICCCTAFSSCKKGDNVPRPDDLIAEDKMVELLAEQYIWEATLDYVKIGVEQYADESTQNEIDTVALQRDTLLYSQISHMVSLYPMPVDSFPDSMDAIYDLAYKFYGVWFKKNHITAKQYDSSLKYYLRTPEASQGFAEKVKNRISKIRQASGIQAAPDPNIPSYAAVRKSPQKSVVR